jgi:hypothetical protein
MDLATSYCPHEPVQVVTVSIAVFDEQIITTRFAKGSHLTKTTHCSDWLFAVPAPLSPPSRAAIFDLRIKHGGAASTSIRSMPGRWYLTFYAANLKRDRLADCILSTLGKKARDAFMGAKDAPAEAHVIRQAFLGIL